MTILLDTKGVLLYNMEKEAENIWLQQNYDLQYRYFNGNNF